jgi:hypothetical protein
MNTRVRLSESEDEKKMAERAGSGREQLGAGRRDEGQSCSQSPRGRSSESPTSSMRVLPSRADVPEPSCKFEEAVQWLQERGICALLQENGAGQAPELAAQGKHKQATSQTELRRNLQPCKLQRQQHWREMVQAEGGRGGCSASTSVDRNFTALQASGS